MSPRAAFTKWAVIGAVVASILMFGQAQTVGGAAGLLQVGEVSDLRPLIEAELGQVPLAENLGHDGQIFYAIGLDLAGDEVGPLLDHAGYRYRRILYSATSSIGGLLDGHALLWSMIVVMVASVGVATGLVALMARKLEMTDWLALAVVANPGVWLSARLMTSDNLALALMLGGLAALVVGARYAVLWFSLSGLTKEVVLVTPTTLFKPKRWLMTAIPILVMGAWTVWVSTKFGGGFSPRSNLDWPFMGIIEAASTWPDVAFRDWFYLVVALATVATAVVLGVIKRGHWLRFPLLGWAGLALCSSNWVWDYGNNAIRVFAPLLVLVVLAMAPSPESETAT